VGDRTALLRNKPPSLVALYVDLERALSRYRGVEIVTKDRYALFRTTRIFADLVFMRDALRLAIHLSRAVADPRFFKVVHGDTGRVAHVTKLHDRAGLDAILPYLKEAYDFAQRDG
jgi:predicted transport protein